METRKICKICYKSFSNGKALGGHVRSHFAKHPLPPNNNHPQPQSQRQSIVVAYSNSILSSSTTVEAMEQCNYNYESDYKNQTMPTRRRSERHRRAIPVVPFSEVSDEEAAWFLIQLSRDTWNCKPKDNEDDEQEKLVVIPSKKLFRCETCNKEFRSYQALGGHKANHKRMLKRKAEEIVDEDEDEDEDGEFVEEEVERGNSYNDNDIDIGVDVKKRGFKCEYCFKVFGSGQALGGHKKAHFVTTLPKNISSRTMVIDLNHPPLSEGF